MEPNARELVRRGVRAAVYRSCWRRLEGDEPGAQALLSCELPVVLADSKQPVAIDDELVRTWLVEDMADFDRAVLVSDLVARRTAGPQAQAPDKAAAMMSRSPVITEVQAGVAADAPVRKSGSPAIADLLDGMLAQERRVRAAG